MWDTHLHTKYSGDSETPVIDMINAAKHAGLNGIIFTDHLDWNYPNEPGLFDLDYYGYQDDVRLLASQNTDIEIGIGVELGLQPHLAARHTEFLQKVSFDFVIGSVHVVEGADPYYPEFFKNRNAEDAYNEYYNCVLKNINEFLDFDSLGHLDYVVRYGLKNLGPEAGRMYFYKHKAQIEEILDIIIRHDKALEINTGSFRYGMKEPNPSYEIISLYKEMGGKSITIGSDAHEAKYVADGFDMVKERLISMGFNSQLVFCKRVAKEISL